jgi:putative endonuclease
MGNWYTYILYSRGIDRYYIGVTDDLKWRLERHNMGWGRYTQSGLPWKIVYYESYKSKTEALKREKEIKGKKSRKYIESLISHAGGRPD